jgi:hypothetical protein
MSDRDRDEGNPKPGTADPRQRPERNQAPLNVAGRARYEPMRPSGPGDHVSARNVEAGGHMHPRVRQGLGSYDDEMDRAGEEARDARRDDEWRRERDEGFRPVDPADAHSEQSRERVALGEGEDERELANREGHGGDSGTAHAPRPDLEWRTENSADREQTSYGQGGPVGSERHGAERYGESVFSEEDQEPGGANEVDDAHARWRDRQLAEMDRRYETWRAEQARRMDEEHRRFRAGDQEPGGTAESLVSGKAKD